MDHKLLTITIPCYNSQDYMDKAIRSVLPGKDKVEILIVDDGSTDDTAAIADKYAKRYPDIVNVIHKENGGHGSAVNTGIDNAKGIFFKVLDSDDWFEKRAYKEYLKTLERLVENDQTVDMFLTNFVYEKPSINHQRRMIFSALFPSDKVIGWKDMKHNIKGFTILMTRKQLGKRSKKKDEFIMVWPRTICSNAYINSSSESHTRMRLTMMSCGAP